MQSGARAASCDEKYVPVDGIDFRMNAFRSRFSAQNQGFHFTFSLRGCTPRQSDLHEKSEMFRDPPQKVVDFGTLPACFFETTFGYLLKKIFIILIIAFDS